MKGRESHKHQYEFGFCVEDRVPADHPLREIKIFVEKVLNGLRHELGDMYSDKGRPSVAPETLLKSLILMALFSIRSERQFCSMLEYNLLFRWFLNMGAMERVFDPTVFSKNRERLINNEIGRKFFDLVVEYMRGAGLLESEHFSVDGSLIGAWASLKSLRERDKDDRDQHTQGKPPSEIGRNDLYVSKSDADAKVACKPGTNARLAYMGNLLMENRHGLCVDVEVLPATGTSEREAAVTMLGRQLQRGIRIKTVGADANYHRDEFIRSCRQHSIAPHVAPQANRKIRGLDNRTWKSSGYAISQLARKGIEKMFGWLKYIAGWDQTRYRGTKRVAFFSSIGVALLNILRSLKLRPSIAY